MYVASASVHTAVCLSSVDIRLMVVHKMQNYAKTHGLTQFISMQNYYNAIYREEEREMAPLLMDMGVGMIPWSPLARGFLTRELGDASDTTRGKQDL